MRCSSPLSTGDWIASEIERTSSVCIRRRESQYRQPQPAFAGDETNCGEVLSASQRSIRARKSWDHFSKMRVNFVRKEERGILQHKTVGFVDLLSFSRKPTEHI